MYIYCVTVYVYIYVCVRVCSLFQPWGLKSGPGGCWQFPLPKESSLYPAIKNFVTKSWRVGETEDSLL